MQDLAAGRIDFFFETAVQLPFTRAGNIKSYAVTSDARLVQTPCWDWPHYPEVPGPGEVSECRALGPKPWPLRCLQGEGWRGQQSLTCS
jgi:hypothetical protein